MERVDASVTDFWIDEMNATVIDICERRLSIALRMVVDVDMLILDGK